MINDVRKGSEFITSEVYEPDEVEVIEDDEGNPVGVALTRYSENACKTEKIDAETTEVTEYTFSAIIMCDKETKAVGGAGIMLVDKSDPCSPVVQMKHASGCPTFTVNAFSRWMKDNPWFLAAIYICIGTLLAFKGRSMFPLAASILFGFLVAKLLIFLAFELNDGEHSPWTTCIIAIIIGAIAGYISRRFLRFLAFIVGMSCGWSIGALIYGFALSFFPDGDILPTRGTFFFFCGFFMIFTIAHSCIEPIAMAKTGTSLIGSFTIMHGWYMVLGGFPDELDLL